jgi:hypothetical protein
MKRQNVKTSKRQNILVPLARCCAIIGTWQSGHGPQRVLDRRHSPTPSVELFDVLTFRRLDVSPRGFVLLAVLVIVASALLVVTAVIYFAQAETAGLAVSRERARHSVMVHSAINVIVPRLNEQRERILSGEAAELADQYELYEADGRLGIVRLLPLREGGRWLEPEAAKLDLNEVEAEQLVATGLVDAELASRIVAFRNQTLGRPFQSVAELLHVEGVSPELLYGPFEEWSITTQAMASDPVDRFSIVPNDLPRGLADVLTVFAFEPALQRDGRRRISLNVPWSAELGRRLDERFGEGAGQVIKQIMDDGTTFDDETVIYRVLSFFSVPPDEWPDIIDTITADEGDYHFGRLDINTASRDALLALPGIQPEQADQIVQFRDGLDEEDRATIAWPAIHGILDPAQYQEIGGKITTRSWTYRLRFAVGEVDADDPDGPIEGAIICEMVVDLSAPKPRIAYLRDVTLLDMAAQLAMLDNLMEHEGDPFGFDTTEREPATLDDIAGFEELMPMDDLHSDEWLEDDDWELSGFAADAESDLAESDRTGSGAPAAATRQRIGRWRDG